MQDQGMHLWTGFCFSDFLKLQEFWIYNFWKFTRWVEQLFLALRQEQFVTKVHPTTHQELARTDLLLHFDIILNNVKD